VLRYKAAPETRLGPYSTESMLYATWAIVWGWRWGGGGEGSIAVLSGPHCWGVIKIGGEVRARAAAETAVTPSKTTMLKFLTAVGYHFESTKVKIS
jgi:hypothetical protein